MRRLLLLALVCSIFACDDGASAVTDAGLDACPGACIPPRPAVQTCGPQPLDLNRLPPLTSRATLPEIEAPTAVEVLAGARGGVWFVAEPDGRAWRHTTGPGSGPPTVVLDLEGRGLRGFSPEPGFDTDGLLYALIAEGAGLRLSRFTVYPGYPEADRRSEEVLAELPDAQDGRLRFDADGALWVTLRPGGLWRYEAEAGLTPALEALEDPERCSADSEGAALWCLDRRAGNAVVVRAEAGAAEEILTLEDDGCGAIGGFPYRGFHWPEQWGVYLVAHGCEGVITAIKRAEGGGWLSGEVARLGGPIRAMTEDDQGRALVIDAEGTLHRLDVAAPDTELGWPPLLSQTGCFESLAPLRPGPDLVPYALNSALWTDGAVKTRYMVVPPGTRIAAPDAGEWEMPPGAVLLKHFAFDTPSGRLPVETRVMVLQPFGWSFHTYRWRPDGLEADLLPGLEAEYADLEVLDAEGAPTPLRYLFPSRVHCQTCHNRRVETVLGPRAAQLERLSGGASQLGAFAEAGLLDRRPEPTAMPDPADASADLEARARAYLHSNCAHCHQPGGWTPPNLGMDLRWSTPLAESGVCGVPTRYSSFGIPGDRRIDPGRPDNSNLLQRMRANGYGRMPLIGTSLVDPLVDTVIGAWIAGLASCP